MKNPARCQSFPLAHGEAHVFYPVADDDLCTAALLLDLDPVGLVRRAPGSGSEGGALRHYVNDRPYVGSSFLSVAIAQVYSSALKGDSKSRPELADTKIPLEAEIPALPCRGGEPFLRRLFEPLGYEVEAKALPLDPQFPEWGPSPYWAVKLRAACRLQDLLTHLYVLLPVLDNDKHYWVGADEVEKLLGRGQGWLDEHPEREEIVARYLKYQRPLIREALAQLVEEEEPEVEANDQRKAQEEEALERQISLNEQRLGTVMAILKQAGARRVLDLGCGEGRLLQLLLKDRDFDRIVGVDVSHRSLEIARDRLNLDRLPPKQGERIELFQAALTYRDHRFAGFDAACLVEVIEHLDLPRLQALERVVFEAARPGTVIVTTPNVEFNARFPSLPAGKLRHRDHRFEWSRAEFTAWCQGVASRCQYQVRYLGIGVEDPLLGCATQVGVFAR